MNSVEYKISRFNLGTSIDEYSSLNRIVISLSRLCNKTCEFCPNKDFKNQDNIPWFISVATIEKIIESLNDKFTGTFSLSGFGEPTLNPDFSIIVDKLKSCHKSRVEVISNGNNISKLLECKADSICISSYNEEDYINFSELCKIDSRITVLDQYKNNHFNNRGGNLKSNKTIPQSCCNILFMKLSIDTDGTILKCCSDWNREDKLGNVYTDSLWDIWINKRRADREEMINDRRMNCKICNKCDAAGSLYGNEYKKFWEDFYGKN